MGGCISVNIESDETPNKSNAKSVAASGGKSVKTAASVAKTKNTSLSSTAPSSATDGSGTPPARRLKLKDFYSITNNFDEDAVLGEGSFGKVYRGVWTDVGSGKGPVTDAISVPVAVKKLNPESFQGYEEWLAEVLLLDKLRHPNLVRLIGYCAEKGEALLMYELCPNGSLDQSLFDRPDGRVLTWEQRVRIALHAAKGLAFLHENNIIHRDFKASNILLAEDWGARLTDFGMARAGPDGGETHISTRVMGTMGYLDPTYMETGRLTRKSDVYAFGVMLLELLTGRRAMGEGEGGQEDQLTTWIRPFLSQRRPDLNQMVDPALNGEYSKAGAVKMAILGKHCIHDDPGLRPEMSTLAENIELVDIKDP